MLVKKGDSLIENFATAYVGTWPTEFIDTVGHGKYIELRHLVKISVNGCF